MIGGVFGGPAGAAKVFFRPAALASLLSAQSYNHRLWKGRVEMTPIGLRLDERTVKVPVHIPDELEAFDKRHR